MSDIRYKPRPKPAGLELTQSQIDQLKGILTDHEAKCRAALEWGTPENKKAAQQADMTLAGWVRPLLHDYLILLSALAPFGAVWDSWAIERVLRTTPFENFNKFAVYMLDDAYTQHFRNATEIFDTLPEDDMPSASELWNAGYQGDEF